MKCAVSRSGPRIPSLRLARGASGVRTRRTGRVPWAKTPRPASLRSESTVELVLSWAVESSVVVRRKCSFFVAQHAAQPVSIEACGALARASPVGREASPTRGYSDGFVAGSRTTSLSTGVTLDKRTRGHSS